MIEAERRLLLFGGPFSAVIEKETAEHNILKNNARADTDDLLVVPNQCAGGMDTTLHALIMPGCLLGTRFSKISYSHGSVRVPVASARSVRWGRHEFCLLAAQFRETVLFWIISH